MCPQLSQQLRSQRSGLTLDIGSRLCRVRVEQDVQTSALAFVRQLSTLRPLSDGINADAECSCCLIGSKSLSRQSPDSPSTTHDTRQDHFRGLADYAPVKPYRAPRKPLEALSGGSESKRKLSGASLLLAGQPGDEPLLSSPGARTCRCRARPRRPR